MFRDVTSVGHLKCLDNIFEEASAVGQVLHNRELRFPPVQPSPGSVPPPVTPAHWETPKHWDVVCCSQHWGDHGFKLLPGEQSWGPLGQAGWRDGAPGLEQEMPFGYRGIFPYLKEKSSARGRGNEGCAPVAPASCRVPAA